MATQSEIEIMQANVRRLDASMGRIDDLLEWAEDVQEEHNQRFGYLTDSGDVLRKASTYGIGCLVVA